MSLLDAAGTPAGDPGAIALSDQAFWALPWHRRMEAFRLLRATPGLTFHPEPDVLPGLVPGPGYYAVTRHADIVEVSRRPEVFSSAAGAVSLMDMPTELLEFYGSMINMDDPRHARLRRLVSRAFTPKVLSKISDDIVAVARELLDAMAPLGECDLVATLSAPFPITVICRMLGIPPSQHELALAMTNIILSGGDPEFLPEGADPITVLLEAGATLAGLMHELAAERTRRPTDDLTSALIHSEVDGERLSSDELASFFILLVVAGNDTTRTALTHAVRALTEHPEQKALWAADPEAVTPTAVEEVVRWASPVGWMRRTVAADAPPGLELGGQPLQPGDKLALFYGSANRDEAVFADPDRFDVRRDPNPHLGFGGPGPHFCLGAHLARRELSVMTTELLRRLPDLEATGPGDQLVSSFINGIKRLPVRFTPQRPQHPER